MIEMISEPLYSREGTQIKKLWYIYTMEYYTAGRKKELPPFASAWMEMESMMLSETSQVAKEKYHMILPISGT